MTKGSLVAALLLAGCASKPPPHRAPPPPARLPATFEEEVAFLQRFGPVIVLADGGGGRVAVSPKYQGRVMTSAVAPGGRSFGWIHRAFLEAGRTGTPFDNYGGEDRFWLGPEGGQFGLFFAPKGSFTFAEWQTPAALNEGEWSVRAQGERRVVLTRSMKVVNHAGTSFELEVERTVTLLRAEEIESRLGVAAPSGVRPVAFETANRITNTGREPWTKDKGLLSVWILGMYAPSPDASVLVPFEAGAAGDLVNDRYFGKVPAGRLLVRDGYLVFTCDGRYRSKIGLPPARAKSVAGSFSPSAKLLTVVSFDRPAGATDYVNSMWEEQKEPYAGDVVNAYNDGPTAPGKPSLGGFYEIESSSPAAALAPGASLAHTHRTFHFVGEAADLAPIAEKALGVPLPP